MDKPNACCASAAQPNVSLTSMSDDAHRRTVRDAYAQVAQVSGKGQSGGNASSCCGVSDDGAINTLISTRLGYSQADLDLAPAGADMGLGCGNPKAIAALKPGETVVDLGSGGGFDCFLAVGEVGRSGQVIGVDMTPEMVSKARANALKGQYENVEFRLGEIEHLPVGDGQVDVILSNCVVNLSPDKPAVLAEAFRVLRNGGRLAISDVVMVRPLPPELAHDVAALTCCVAGAAMVDDLRRWLDQAGFRDVQVTIDPASRDFIRDWLPGSGVEDHVASATIEAVKPGPRPKACCPPGAC